MTKLTVVNSCLVTCVKYTKILIMQVFLLVLTAHSIVRLAIPALMHHLCVMGISIAQTIQMKDDVVILFRLPTDSFYCNLHTYT